MITSIYYLFVNEYELISKLQADAIANTLLEQAREENFRNGRLPQRPIALLYRCRELKGLPTKMQAEVVSQATKIVFDSPYYLALGFALIGSMAGLWFYLRGFEKSSHTAGFMGALCWVPIAFRGIFVRHQIKIIAARLRPLVESSDKS